MTKGNQLLNLLDQVFGFRNKKTSTYKKIRQIFDERTNEHVILIEYRVRRGGEMPVARKTRSPEELRLMKELNMRARSKKNK